MALLTAALPIWWRWAAIGAALTAIFFLGQLHGERRAGQVHLDYVAAQAAQTVKVAKRQTDVVIKTEIEYRDRIQKIYIKGDVIEKLIPTYITPADDMHFGVNAGWVRVTNAAWAGELAGPAAESDRDPAGIPLADIAAAEAHNATSARIWQEQALGCRAFYKAQRAVVNRPNDVNP